MIISEFLPNPVGKDTDGEFIELFNNGSEAVNLVGWKLKDASAKTFTFTRESIRVGEYLILDYKTTKISLNNNGETLYLYDSQGRLIDKAEYVGTAVAGQSLIRQNGKFVFTKEPTPGKANIFNKEQEEESAAAMQAQSYNSFSSAVSRNNPASINGSSINFSYLFLGAAIALILAALFVIIWKKLDAEK